MKKAVLILLVIISMYLISRDEYNITEDSIRFRVIANSNSVYDIAMKEKVVKEISNILFVKTNTKEETEANIYNNIKNIEDKIDLLFKKNNYDKSYNISYGLNNFPEKTYRGKKYEKGLYKSLVIEIGEGKGNNYFCILYPSLCMLDYEEKEEKSNYKFKIIEVIKNVF